MTALRAVKHEKAHWIASDIIDGAIKRYNNCNNRKGDLSTAVAVKTEIFEAKDRYVSSKVDMKKVK